MNWVKNWSTQKKKALMWACEFPLYFEDSEMCVGFFYFPDRLFVKRHDPQSGSTFLSELRSIRCIMTSGWTKIRQSIRKEEKRNIISATRDTFCILLKICLQFFLGLDSRYKQTILRFQHWNFLLEWSNYEKIHPASHFLSVKTQDAKTPINRFLSRPIIASFLSDPGPIIVYPCQ